MSGRLGQKHAAIRIQKIVRGLIGRNEVRAEFVAIYTKHFDADVGACYYTNNLTQENSWYKPYITTRLW